MRPTVAADHRTNARYLPSLERAQSSSVSPCGGEVSLRSSPLVTDMADRPEPPLRNPSDAPSEVQQTLLPLVSTTFCSAPPNGDMRYTAPPRRKAMCWPSGDHAGAVSGAGSVVSRKGRPPEVNTT